jgi:hypothetical protein
MSDINGEGYGSSHNWAWKEQAGTHTTLYICRDCSEHFYHNYHHIDNIFEAMAKAEVPDECVGLPGLQHNISGRVIAEEEAVRLRKILTALLLSNGDQLKVEDSDIAKATEGNLLIEEKYNHLTGTTTLMLRHRGEL